MVFIFTPIHIYFTHKHQFVEIIGKKNNHMVTNGTNVSSFCPVRNLLFHKKHKEKMYILKMCIVFFYTHSNYKICIKAYLPEIISKGDIAKVTNGTSVRPNLVLTKKSLFCI